MHLRSKTKESFKTIHLEIINDLKKQQQTITNVALLMEALFFRPHPGGFDTSGICHPRAKKNGKEW